MLRHRMFLWGWGGVGMMMMFFALAHMYHVLRNCIHVRSYTMIPGPNVISFLLSRFLGIWMSLAGLLRPLEF